MQYGTLTLLGCPPGLLSPVHEEVLELILIEVLPPPRCQKSLGHEKKTSESCAKNLRSNKRISNFAKSREEDQMGPGSRMERKGNRIVQASDF